MQLVFLSEYFDYHKFLEAPQKLKLFLKWPDTSIGQILGNTGLESICKVNIVNYCSFKNGTYAMCFTVWYQMSYCRKKSERFLNVQGFLGRCHGSPC